MKIRAGYEISYECSQPTPMILTLSVHPSRFPDPLTIDRLRLDPPIPFNTYHDSFGGSRYCETDRLSNTAWSLFGQLPKGWPLVSAIRDYVHDRIAFGYQRASSKKNGVGRS
jgi:hypothetical protein